MCVSQQFQSKMSGAKVLSIHDYACIFILLVQAHIEKILLRWFRQVLRPHLYDFVGFLWWTDLGARLGVDLYINYYEFATS